MIKLHTLGSATTTPSDGIILSNIIDNLSETGTELLCFIAEELEEEDESNEFGIYVDHDKHGCSSFSSAAYDELINFGIVTIHHSSESNAALMHCNQDIYDLLVDFGEIIED